MRYTRIGTDGQLTEVVIAAWETLVSIPAAETINSVTIKYDNGRTVEYTRVKD